MRLKLLLLFFRRIQRDPYRPGLRVTPQYRAATGPRQRAHDILLNYRLSIVYAFMEKKYIYKNKNYIDINVCPLGHLMEIASSMRKLCYRS